MCRLRTLISAKQHKTLPADIFTLPVVLCSSHASPSLSMSVCQSLFGSPRSYLCCIFISVCIPPQPNKVWIQRATEGTGAEGKTVGKWSDNRNQKAFSHKLALVCAHTCVSASIHVAAWVKTVIQRDNIGLMFSQVLANTLM